MDSTQKYAPLLHTAFDTGYTREEMRAFIEWIDARGFSGFSAEGKASPPTRDIDGWIEGFIRGMGYAVEEAEKKGMDAWLFDEWGYPTGTAAGKTMAQHPQWRSKRLYLAMDIMLEAGQTVDVSVPPGFLSAAAWHIGRDAFGQPLSKEDTALTPEDGRLRHTAVHRRERVCVACWSYDNMRTVGIFVPDPEDPAQGTLDLMCREAVAYLLTQMHARYLPAFGEAFGKTFKGFFYDEPYLSFPAPYTFDILPEFQAKKRYDLTPLLPRMLAGVAGDALSDYRDVCTTRTAEAFYGQMQAWCHAHGVDMVGHQDLDHSPRTLDSVSGHFFKNSAFSDAPGVDYIWAQLQPGVFTDFPRYAGSARRLLGKAHAVSESFAATGKNLYPDFMRFCLDHQILRGVDRFYLMVADPVPKAGIAPTPVSRDHLQSVHFGAAFNHRVALSNRLMQEAGRPAAHIALYLPMDAFFRGLQVKGHNLVNVGAPYRHAWDYVEDAARALCHLPVEFEYLWREALLSLPLEGGALITPQGQRIDTIIWPATFSLEAGVLERLSAFIAQGGRLICLNSPPDALIGQAEVCGDASRLFLHITPEITLTNPGWVSVAHRQAGERHTYFLLNEDEHPHTTALGFPVPGPVARYDFQREAWISVESPGAEITLCPMELSVFTVGGGVPAEAPRLPVGEAQSLGDFTAITPEGGRVDLSQGLRDAQAFYRPDYTGFMAYETTFDISRDGLYRLDLGRVCYAARVLVDDAAYTCAFAPYTLDLSLAQGRHRLRVEVLNTDVNENMGTPETEKAHLDEANRGWLRTKMGGDRKYLTSGLLGPVTLCAIR